jgi:aminoglycoside/choline kinase family phosphotransferase
MATQTLVALHGRPAPAGLASATPDHLAEATEPAFTWYARDPDLFPAARAALQPLLEAHARPEDVVVLRDYHAENLLALPGRSGAARTGVLDFQDALIGHSAYDLVSLCRDPRRDLHPGTEAACLAAYIDATDTDRAGFETAYALLGVQRNLRILGIFARLAQRDGKPRYLDFLPRTHAHVMAQARHPALAPLRPVLDALPLPTPDLIDRLRQPCPTP